MSDMDLHAKEIETAFKDVVAAWRVYKFVFEKWPLGIVFLDAEGNFIMVNNEFCRIIQRIPVDVVGHNWREFTHPDDMDSDLDRIARNQVAESKSEHVYEAVKYYVSATGRRIPTHVWVMVVGEPDDQVKSVAMVQKMAEENDGT